MTGRSKIIDRIESVSLISGVDFFVDTKGLDCFMKVHGGDIGITLYGNDGDAFLLKDGESIDFCGKIGYRHSTGSPVVYLMYYHTL